MYIGTSGFNIHKRSLEHIRAVQAKNQKNALAKHMALYHQNEDGNFVTTCLAGGIRYNLDRFILEAIEIKEANKLQLTDIIIICHNQATVSFQNDLLKARSIVYLNNLK